MKRILLLATLALFAAMPLTAQTMNFGLQLGAGNPMNDDFDVDLDDRIREIYFGVEMEPTTLFTIKAGQYEDADFTGRDDAQVDVDYISAQVEYRFSEVFGSTGIFAGPGFYRANHDARAGDLLPDDDESDYGISVGVNGHFPVTRHIGLTAEAAYHWTKLENNFDLDGAGNLTSDEEFTFLALTGGVRFNF